MEIEAKETSDEENGVQPPDGMPLPPDDVRESAKNIFRESEISRCEDQRGKKMKPFDLEAAQRGEPLMFGNGQSAFWLGFNALNAKTPVVVTTEFGTILQYTEQGYPRDPDDLDWQLFMAPRKVQLWINLYWHGEYSADIFRTRHEADKHERLGRLGGRACLFEYEESPAPIAMNAASAILPD